MYGGQELQVGKGIKAPFKSATNTTTKAVNQSSKAILKDGYYEVNGFKFSKYYYIKLWNTGRGAATLVAKEALAGGAKTAGA
jgi:hypothetical protein